MNFNFIFLHISFRYIAVSHPHYYRDINARMNPMKRVLCYAVPVTTFSILVNIPKFLETEVSTVSKIFYLLTYLYRVKLREKLINKLIILCLMKSDDDIGF